MTIKEEVLNAISSLPDDMTIEQAMYRLYVLERIHRAEEDFLQARVISHEELVKEAESW